MLLKKEYSCASLGIVAAVAMCLVSRKTLCSAEDEHKGQTE